MFSSAVPTAIFALMVSKIPTIPLSYNHVTFFKIFAKLMGKDVAADDVFVCIGLYGLVQYSTTKVIPVAISYYAEGISSIQRIQAHI